MEKRSGRTRRQKLKPKKLPPGAPISNQRRAEDTKRATGYEKTTTYNISNYCQFLSKIFIKKAQRFYPPGPIYL